MGAYFPVFFAARIGELSDLSWLEQAKRFVTFSDPAVFLAVVGCIMLGIACGLMGSFIVVRRMALLGDTLSHAVLPGIAAAFLWSQTRNPLIMLGGALAAGLAAAWLVNAIRSTTIIKEDSAMGMVLGGFYGLGIVIITIIQGAQLENKAGIDKIFFGQAAALSMGDVVIMAASAFAAAILITFFYKGLLCSAFDPAYARSLLLPVRLLQGLIAFLLTLSVVAALQAVGVVLVSAMLIIPAATAIMLSNRMHGVLILSAVFGSLSGIVGAFLSFLGAGLPTGPLIVLVAVILFWGAFLLAPQRGLIARWIARSRRSRIIYLENLLKNTYQILERDEASTGVVTQAGLAELRRESLSDAARAVRDLVRSGLAEYSPKHDPNALDPAQQFQLTDEGAARARRIVRSHRIWELYLTNRAKLAPDHVHDDADVIEHILEDDMLDRLEKALQNPTHDPHGSRIPVSGNDDITSSARSS